MYLSDIFLFFKKNFRCWNQFMTTPFNFYGSNYLRYTFWVMSMAKNIELLAQSCCCCCCWVGHVPMGETLSLHARTRLLDQPQAPQRAQVSSKLQRGGNRNGSIRTSATSMKSNFMTFHVSVSAPACDYLTSVVAADFYLACRRSTAENF